MRIALIVACVTGFPLETPSAAPYQHWNVSDIPDALSMLQLHAWKRNFGADRLPRASVFEQGSNRSGKKQKYSKKKTHVSPIAGCEGLDCVKQYIALPDSNYNWHDTGHRLSGIDESSSTNWTGYVLNMTSQSWLTEANAEFPIWWHTLVIIVPSNLEITNWSTLIPEFGIDSVSGAFMIQNRITEAAQSYSMELDDQTLENKTGDLEIAVWKAARVATHTHSIAACLFNPLNEYQTFSNDPLHVQRSGDDIKSYAWEDFLKNGADEPERIMELPVAKSLVRAMDTITAFTATMANDKVTRFGVWGYSKLGMATMMVGAIDPRVEAIAPTALVFEIPYNLQQVFQTTSGEALLQGVGQYDFLLDWAGTEEWEKLWKIVNFQYWISNLTVPTFFIMDTMDTWFDAAIADIARWWPQWPGPKNLLFVEAQHSTAITLSAPEVTAFFHAHLLGVPMPKIEYSFNQSSENLVVQQISPHMPTSVNLHSTSTCLESYVDLGQSYSPRFGLSTWTVEPLVCDEKATCTTWVANLDTNRTNFNQAPNLSDLSRIQSSPAEVFRHNCSRGAFISFSYEGPGLSVDPFQISTPVFVAYQ